MTSKHLERLIVGGEIPEFFKPNSNLDTLDQAKEAVILMNYPLSEKLVFEGRVFENQTVFWEGYFKGLITDLESKLNSLTEQCIREPFPKIQAKKGVGNVGILTDLIYSPDKILNLNGEKLGIYGAMDDVRIQNAQATLLLGLMQKFKPHIDVVRNLNYRLIESQELQVHCEDFFISDKDAGQGQAWRRMMFGLLTCHIGYFAKPQYGKWELIYGHRADLEVGELMKRGLSLVPRTREEINRDLEQQLNATTLMLKNSIRVYDRLSEENAIILHELEKSKNRMPAPTAKESKRVVKNKPYVTKELRMMVQEVLGMLPENKKRPNYTNERVQRMKRELKEQEDSYDRLDDENEYLLERIKYLETKLMDVNKNPYEVRVEIPDRKRKVFSPMKEKVLKWTVGKLRKDPTGGVLMRRSNSRIDKNLDRAYPDAEQVYKFESHDYRVIYAPNHNSIKILDVLHHSEYDKLLAERKV